MRDRDGFLWLVVAADFARERLAREHLEEAGFKVLWPHYLAESTHARKVTTALRSYFPPILFVAIDHPSDDHRDHEDTIGAIKNTRRVDAVYWKLDNPHYLSPGWLRKKLKPKLLNAEGLVEPPEAQIGRARYNHGDIVQVNGGPFAGFLAMVVADYGKSIDVEHELFGRPSRHTYDPAQVEQPMVAEMQRTSTH